MTSNLKSFALFCLIWSIAFFTFLNHALYDEEKYGIAIIVIAAMYGIGFGLAGWVFGRRDSQQAVRYDLGWYYSMTSTVVAFIVGAGWVAFFQPDKYLSLIIYLIIATIIQLPHYLSKRKSIKGIDRKELFK